MIERVLREPTLLVEAVRQFIYLIAVLEVVKLTDDQSKALVAFVSIALAVVNRALVTPSARPETPTNG